MNSWQIIPKKSGAYENYAKQLEALLGKTNKKTYLLIKLSWSFLRKIAYCIISLY